MSHITKRKSSMRNPEFIKRAAKRVGAEYLGLQSKGRGGAGFQVKLPGWHYPVTINKETGECVFDNYEGRWGDEKHLDALKQGYAVEATKAQAEELGHTFEEELLPNGDIKCVIPLGGSGYEMAGSGAGGGGGYDV